jgi:hypothetical protein
MDRSTALTRQDANEHAIEVFVRQKHIAIAP